MPIAGYGSVYEARVDLVDSVVVHAVLLQRTWNVILHEDVACRRELMEDLDSGWVLERECKRLLVAVYLCTR